MPFGTERSIRNGRELSIKVGETIIENVNSAKLLGVVIDRFLSWSTHTEALTKKTVQLNWSFTKSPIFYVLLGVTQSF